MVAFVTSNEIDIAVTPEALNESSQETQETAYKPDAWQHKMAASHIMLHFSKKFEIYKNISHFFKKCGTPQKHKTFYTFLRSVPCFVKCNIFCDATLQK